MLDGQERYPVNSSWFTRTASLSPTAAIVRRYALKCDSYSAEEYMSSKQRCKIASRGRERFFSRTGFPRLILFGARYPSEE